MEQTLTALADKGPGRQLSGSYVNGTYVHSTHIQYTDCTRSLYTPTLSLCVCVQR